ncbi:hypothetical protein GCM10007363_14030 [Pseudomonas fluvialis]|uniref:Uncharacterized protein n=1 Tax=Pseudomonas fluvialis TaxID=1793966 RepID=A0ABQ2AJQ3_9PSED|nr:hypothetical protein GCM10007363_14030 [Pseudomonas fluvialis]
MENQAAGSAGGVDLFLQAFKAHASGFEVGSEAQQLGHRAAEAVKPPDNQNIARSCKCQRFIKTGARCFGTTHLVAEDPLATGSGQRVMLKIELLIIP